MKPFAIILSAAVLAPAIAQAQFTPGLGREIPCYGGQNPGGAYVCACDQGHISGSAALILGGSSQKWGPGTLPQCLAWADSMAAAASAPSVQPPSPPVSLDPPKTTPPPNLGRKPTPRTPQTPPPLKIVERDQCDIGFNLCRGGGAGTETCVMQYNACADAVFRDNYNAAVAAGQVWP